MIDQRRKEGGGGSATKPKSERASSEGASLPHELSKEFTEFQNDAKLLMDQLTKTGDGLARIVEDQVKARPHVALGIGVGIGYVLGGGLPNFVSKAAVRLGFRAAVSFAVGRIIQNISADAEA